MKYIGIIVAMEEEKEAVERIMEDIETKEIYNLKFLIGKIEGKNCVLVKSGVGKVNAGRTTQVLIDNFEIEFLINQGASGAINHMLDIGDVVIAKHVLQHDFDITAFGHSKGYITGVGDKIESDKKLVKTFENILENEDEKNYNIKMGIVATGDIFCTEPGMKDKINAKFDADVVDMECAAIAQVAHLDNVPFISIRCISDIPNDENASTFDENLEMASRRCAILLKQFCKESN